MKKIICAALGAILLGSAMTACNEEEEKHQMLNTGDIGNDANITEDEMPYGSTIYQLLPENDENIKYTMEFDKRYFGGEDNDLREVYILHDYIKALNENDHEKIKSLYYPGYLEYMCSIGGYLSVDQYLDSVNAALTEALGEGFEIDYINISNCLTEKDEDATSYFIQAESVLYTVDSSLEEKITSKKVTEIGGYTCYSTPENSYIFVNHTDALTLLVYEIDGKIYLL